MRENKPGSPTELVLRFPFIPKRKTHKTRCKKLNPSSLHPPTPPPAPPSVQMEPLWGRTLRGAKHVRAPGSSPQPCEMLGCQGGGAEHPPNPFPGSGPAKRLGAGVGGRSGSTSNRETKVNCSATIRREGALKSLQAT